MSYKHQETGSGKSQKLSQHDLQAGEVSKHGKQHGGKKRLPRAVLPPRAAAAAVAARAGGKNVRLAVAILGKILL